MRYIIKNKFHKFSPSQQWCSGAGTHGNGVPTREILRDIFSLLLLNYSYFPLLPFTFHARQTMCQNWTTEFAKY